VVNTDLHNENFLIDGQRCVLIDWEKPNLAEPSKDLCHFLQPTTTLWKTDFTFDARARRRFLETYRSASTSIYRDEIMERMESMAFFTMLRAVTWSAMRWAECVSDESLTLTDERTFKVIERFIEPGFLQAAMHASSQ
jgi:2-phospho-L-lactate guanylyltransferase